MTTHPYVRARLPAGAAALGAAAEVTTPVHGLCAARKEIELGGQPAVSVWCGRIEGHVTGRLLHPYTHTYFGADFEINWLEWPPP